MIDEQLKRAALASHSSLFLGHLFTGTTVSSDTVHEIATVVLITSHATET